MLFIFCLNCYNECVVKRIGYTPHTNVHYDTDTNTFTFQCLDCKEEHLFQPIALIKEKPTVEQVKLLREKAEIEKELQKIN